MLEESFADAVRDKLAFLITDHGFQIVEQDPHCVRLEASTLCAEAWWDPRGEVSVYVYRPGLSDAGTWSYDGMVGTASVSRLLEIAGERMRADRRVLAADVRYYYELADEKRKISEEWTTYYSGNGPRPGPRRFP